MPADIQIPPIIKFGAGLLREVPDVVSRLGCARPLIVTDRVHGHAGPAGGARRSSDAGGCASASMFSDTVPDPTSDVVDAGVRGVSRPASTTS